MKVYSKFKKKSQYERGYDIRISVLTSKSEEEITRDGVLINSLEGVCKAQDLVVDDIVLLSTHAFIP